MTVIGHNHIRRVENFDAFEVIAHPLPRREDRSFKRSTESVGVTYGSHDVRIARPVGIAGVTDSNRLAILMQHGGGCYVLEFYESALPIAAALLLLPEREQYALAYTLFKQADEAAEGAKAQAHAEWAKAHVDGRIRRQRRPGGRVRVYVETPDEMAFRQGKKVQPAAI